MVKQIYKSRKSFDHPTEPLTWSLQRSLGFTNGVPSEQSVNPQSATKVELACYDKSYALAVLLGCMYAAGVGVSKYSKAFELYEGVFVRLDIYGCAQQGLLYAQQDYQSALYIVSGLFCWFTQHCSAIGDIYNQGVGISKDTDKAISYYQRDALK